MTLFNSDDASFQLAVAQAYNDWCIDLSDCPPLLDMVRWAIKID